MAAVSSNPLRYHFGHSGKQCSQLIKHLRYKPARVVSFLWPRHPSSSIGLGLQSQLISLLSVGKLWLVSALACGFTGLEEECVCLCVHVLSADLLLTSVNIVILKTSVPVNLVASVFTGGNSRFNTTVPRILMAANNNARNFQETLVSISNNSCFNKGVCQ